MPIYSDVLNNNEECELIDNFKVAFDLRNSLRHSTLYLDFSNIFLLSNNHKIPIIPPFLKCGLPKISDKLRKDYYMIIVS